MSWLSSLAYTLIAKPAAYVAGRIGGSKAAADVLAVVNTGIAKELATAVPVISSDIDKAAQALVTAANVTIDYARAKFVALVGNVKLSDDASSKIVSAIEGVPAPVVAVAAAGVAAAAANVVENVVDNAILAFAADVKAALAKL